jgi:hypothetical protein
LTQSATAEFAWRRALRGRIDVALLVTAVARADAVSVADLVRRLGAFRRRVRRIKLFEAACAALGGVAVGFLTLFLLDMGATAASALTTTKVLNAKVVAFGVVAPMVFGTLGALLGTAAGLGAGGAGVLATMAASASYIAAPAATRLALPEANPGLALGISLGVTFPFNLAVGVPVYFAIARALA